MFERFLDTLVKLNENEVHKARYLAWVFGVGGILLVLALSGVFPNF